MRCLKYVVRYLNIFGVAHLKLCQCNRFSWCIGPLCRKISKEVRNHDIVRGNKKRIEANLTFMSFSSIKSGVTASVWSTTTVLASTFASIFSTPIKMKSGRPRYYEWFRSKNLPANTRLMQWCGLDGVNLPSILPNMRFTAFAQPSL